MRASFTFQQLINNRGLRSFFMRDQAYKTLEELCERSDMYMDDVAEIIDEYDNLLKAQIAAEFECAKFILDTQTNEIVASSVELIKTYEL